MLFLVSCSEINTTREDKGDLEEIFIGDDSKIIDDISQVVYDIEVIPYSGNSTLSEVRKLLSVNDSLYFILDQLVYGNIIVTDNNFDEVKRLNFTGSGPGEYDKLTDAIIDEKENRLLVYDFQRQKMFKYDFEGKFQNSQRIAYYVTSFEMKDGLLYFTSAKHENVVNDSSITKDLFVIKYPETDQIINTYKPFDQDKFQEVRLHNTTPFHKVSNSIYFNEVLEDTIFTVDKNSIVPRFRFRYKNETIKPNLLENGHSELVKILIEKPDELAFKSYLTEVKFISINHIFYKYVHKNKLVFGVYDISKKENYEFQNQDMATNYSIFKPLLLNKDGSYITAMPLYMLSHFGIDDENIRKKYDDDEHVVFIRYKVNI